MSQGERARGTHPSQIATNVGRIQTANTPAMKAMMTTNLRVVSASATATSTRRDAKGGVVASGGIFTVSFRFFVNYTYLFRVSVTCFFQGVAVWNVFFFGDDLSGHPAFRIAIMIWVWILYNYFEDEE